MSLVGNLRTMDLPEILQWIAGGRKTGTLYLEHRSIRKRITFREGVIHTSWSNDPRESLGQFLVGAGLLSEEQLFGALLRQEKEGRLLGAILVGDGVLGEGELREALRAKVEESIYDLFLWPEGHFEFKDGEMPPAVPVAVDLEVTGVILEGARRADDWARIRAVFPSTSVRFVVPRGVPDEVTDPHDRAVLELAAQGHTLCAIALQLHRSEYDTAARALGLHAGGFLAAAGEEPPVPADPAARIRQLLSDAGQRMGEKRYVQALESFEAVLTVDRLNQDAKKGLIAVVEAKNRDRQLRTVPLGKVPVLKMELKDLTRLDFDAQEGFVLSRVNGEWDVQSILKLCPMSEEDALLIFARLLERDVIEMR